MDFSLDGHQNLKKKKTQIFEASHCRSPRLLSAVFYFVVFQCKEVLPKQVLAGSDRLLKSAVSQESAFLCVYAYDQLDNNQTTPLCVGFLFNLALATDLYGLF